MKDSDFNKIGEDMKWLAVQDVCPHEHLCRGGGRMKRCCGSPGGPSLRRNIGGASGGNAAFDETWAMEVGKRVDGSG
jgi:hypothetical protein